LNRPRITLKIASSLDGKIALANGQSEWITCEEARKKGREFRAEHDAIAVGANTAVLDNPQLTTRLQGRKDPHRIVFDSNLRLSTKSNLAQTARNIPVTLFCENAHACDSKKEALEALGVRVLAVKRLDSGLDITTALAMMKNLSIKTMLLEGGGTLAASFICLGVVDQIEWFRAPVILGAEGRPAIGDLNLSNINQIYRFERIEVNEIGTDIWERYQLKPKL
jgi:diaminohydroxyphosphoribosylaminopyrimidine deaminase/5-amino-6-(5-phosphoribosylamino)uracil reductase